MSDIAIIIGDYIEAKDPHARERYTGVYRVESYTNLTVLVSQRFRTCPTGPLHTLTIRIPRAHVVAVHDVSEVQTLGAVTS